MLTRRQFTSTCALVAAAAPLLASDEVHAQKSSGGGTSSASATGHDMPAHWMGKEKMAFLIYPQFTALDMVGPHYMFANVMGAKVDIVAKTREPVVSDNGLTFVPTVTFDECPPELDVICVPGGSTGTLNAMQDEATMKFLKERGGRAKFVTSVCTGSLLLGAAGLLDGYRATSHWAAKDLLPIFGATAAPGRFVRDRNRITGGGVTAGIDFGLYLVGQLRDREYAEGVQLIAEYAPEPPFDSGLPERASVPIKKIIDDMFEGFVRQAREIGESAYSKAKRPL